MTLVWVCLVLKQPLDTLELPMLTSNKQWGPSIPVSSVHVCTKVHQRCEGFEPPILTPVVHSSPPPLISSSHLCSRFTDQIHHVLHIDHSACQNAFAELIGLVEPSRYDAPLFEDAQCCLFHLLAACFCLLHHLCLPLHKLPVCLAQRHAGDFEKRGIVPLLIPSQSYIRACHIGRFKQLRHPRLEPLIRIVLFHLHILQPLSKLPEAFQDTISNISAPVVIFKTPHIGLILVEAPLQLVVLQPVSVNHKLLLPPHVLLKRQAKRVGADLHRHH
mmetsp:Transcript_32379/g.81589  ORF Transcript_32379/g.81589 Transcript_32379/m.81589 type:complete len:274 (+) Transcript_32379:2-823(+)